MGNKSSQPEDGQGVKRREKKGKKGGDRPLSDPGMVSMDANFSYGPRRPSDAIVTSRSASVSNINYRRSSDDLHRNAPLTKDKSVKPKDIYNRSLEKVLEIWSEYLPLKNLNPDKMSPQVVQTLNTVYMRLIEQQSMIRTVSREKHEVSQELDQKKQDIQAQEQLLRDKGTDINDLQDDIAILRGELKRKGFDSKLPQRNRIFSLPESSLRTHSRQPSDTSEVFSDTDSRVAGKVKMGFLQPTPLLQAEGGRFGSAVKRSHSLRPADTSNASNSPGTDRRTIDDLNEKLRRLQNSLDFERRENKLLHDRLDNMQNSISNQRVPQKLSTDTLMDEYLQLENQGTSRILRLTEQYLRHVNQIRRARFFCAIFQAAFSTASTTVYNFQQTLQTLLTNPTEPLKVAEGNYRPGMRVNGKKSRDLPLSVLDKVQSYIESTSDETDLTNVIEATADSLSQEYPDCTTPALINDPKFQDFLHDCCFLSWKMNAKDPPMYISTDLGSGYVDDRTQNIHNIEQIGNKYANDMYIECFMWPILYDRRHGQMVAKGRVWIK